MPWKWPVGDVKKIVGTHWSYDPGSETVARELVSALGCLGLFSRYSRLLIDPNRTLDSDTLVRKLADKETVLLNQNLTKEDLQNRIENFYNPYHTVLQGLVKERFIQTVLSIHSFTPIYEGKPRKTEIGVLFHDDKEEELAKKFQAEFQSSGISSQLNEPWSGKEGFMYAVQQTAHQGRKALMFEFRNELLANIEWRKKAVKHMVDVIQAQKLDVRHA